MDGDCFAIKLRFQDNTSNVPQLAVSPVILDCETKAICLTDLPKSTLRCGLFIDTVRKLSRDNNIDPKFVKGSLCSFINTTIRLTERPILSVL